MSENRKNEKNNPDIPKIEQDKPDYATVFWLFFFGSITGFILEGLWRILLIGRWENHAATVWGPFCLVYGIGAVAMYLVTRLLADKSFFVQFLGYGAAGAAVEYIASYLQELFFGSRSWDYSGDPFNLNGRISLQMTAIWGLLGVAFAKFAFPLIEKARLRTKGRTARLLCVILSVYMAVNLCLTAASVFRWAERINGKDPSNRTERFLDRYFDDERMASIFNNMEFGTAEDTAEEAGHE